MREISGAPLATAVSAAKGLGFIAAGDDLTKLNEHLQEAQDLIATTKDLHQYSKNVLPVGVGFLNWGAPLHEALAAIITFRPAAVWLFGPRHDATDLIPWVDEIRAQNGKATRIWIQVGCVADAIEAMNDIQPDVIVVQGADGGGHGLNQSASILTLLPETIDRFKEVLTGRFPNVNRPRFVAAGGIIDGRGIAAAHALGAEGCVMGSRFLASMEANIAKGYQAEILRISDGGTNTVRSTIYDHARGGSSWPIKYAARGIINKTYEDYIAGKVTEQDNFLLYQDELAKGDRGWGPDGRMATYAGTGVGLIKSVMAAGDIVRQVRGQARDIMSPISLARL
jgi:nitronate monooxygenase